MPQAAAIKETVNKVMSEPPHEGEVTSRVERVTAKMPSLGFLGLAVGSMIASAALQLSGRRQVSNFVGLWAPSLLIIGVYNKLVKLEHEFQNRNQSDNLDIDSSSFSNRPTATI
jgi:hypothetical protein